MLRSILKLQPVSRFNLGERALSLLLRRFDTNNRPVTLKELYKSLTRETGAQEVFDPAGYAKERSSLLTVLPKSQDELPSRTQRDSYMEVILQMSSDMELREEFINVFMGIRTGRLLECLDAFAGMICLKYALNPKQVSPSPFCMVTALVDNLTFSPGAYVDPSKDFLLTGFVSWVGKSSMEVTMSVLQENVEKIRAVFVMVARDPLNRGSAVVNPMVFEDDLDQAYFKNGKENMERRKKASAETLSKTAPNAEESKLIHEMFMKSEEHSSAGQPGDQKLMSDALFSDISVCHPSHRNRYNKVFGGYVMRMAYELGWASATSFCRSRVGVSFIDDIWFRAPVEVGSILHFTSVIGYTQDNAVLVRVRADVENYLTGSKDLTNTFYFTFNTLDGTRVPMVMPTSYKEYVTYLDSRRHFLKLA